jgi:hypothetical protein
VVPVSSERFYYLFYLSSLSYCKTASQQPCQLLLLSLMLSSLISQCDFLGHKPNCIIALLQALPLHLG